MGKKRKKRQIKAVQRKAPVKVNPPAPAKTEEPVKSRETEPVRIRAGIEVGDRVIMNDRYKVGNDIIGLIWTVVEGPTYLEGKRRVRLDGYPKWYPVDGLKVVG